jgi:SNF2 family DNA or RNA helicase
VDGIRWLQQRWREGMPGVLLADDMGLGKTLQALAFLVWLRDGMQASAVPLRPILVVAPTGLLKTWEEEHCRHLAEPGLGQPLRGYGPELRGLRAEGRGNELEVGRALLDAERLRSADWILTTYETMRDYQHSFGAVRYAAIVFDEAQRIKTPGTLMTNAAKALNGDFVIAMTGTPVENRLADLWCIVDTAVPGLLRDLKSFSAEFENHAEREKLTSLKVQLTEGLFEGSGATPPVMLRRMKADHLPGLPVKHEHVRPEVMPPEQAAAYGNAVAAARTDDGRGRILEALHRLRGISLHPFAPGDAQEVQYVDQSARFRVMFEVLDRVHQAGEKCLIFLEDLAMQAYLAALLQRRYRLPRLPMLINGGIAGADRQARVNAFQNAGTGFDVMILSPRAGGVGLTLTAANHVVHLSRWWNPAVEDQCTDRVYRIGQEREVHVHLPQARHPEFEGESFDCKLHALLDRKRALSRELLAPPLDALRDAEELFKQTVGGTAQAGGDPGSASAPSAVAT